MQGFYVLLRMGTLSTALMFNFKKRNRWNQTFNLKHSTPLFLILVLSLRCFKTRDRDTFRIKVTMAGYNILLRVEIPLTLIKTSGTEKDD